MPTDPYEVDQISRYLMSAGGWIFGPLLKRIDGLGDRLAVSILIGTNEADFSRPEVAMRAARLLGAAFNKPSIQCEIDRTPRVALFVLERILQKTNDEAAREIVARTLVELRNVAAQLETRP